MKIRSSTKIGVGFTTLVLAGYFGYQTYMDRAIADMRFTPVVPGRVNLVGIDTGAGYRIIVANQMAQLVQTQGDFGGKETEGSGATEGSIKKRVPIKEMLAVLRGNQKAVGQFVMVMNNMNENDLPPIAPVWLAEDLKKALDGDAPLSERLVRDINLQLDGTPLPRLRISALENGIIVDSPVRVRVNMEGVEKVVEGRVREAYRPRIMRSVETRLAEKPTITPEMQAGFYMEEARQILDGKMARENLRESIAQLISENTARQRVDAAERVLKSATVVVSDRHIGKADFREYDTNDGKRYDLRITMTDEGRKRMWKFSRNKIGTQLLVVADGVAIEAPRIPHVLAQGELTITQMRDRVLVRDAVDMLNRTNRTTRL